MNRWGPRLWRSVLADTFPKASLWASLKVLALACGVRTAFLFLWPDVFVADPDAYRVLAETLDRFGVLGVPSSDGIHARATAFRPPLYPWLLSWLVVDGSLSPALVGCFHVVIGGLTATLAYRIVLQIMQWRFVNPPDAKWPEIEIRGGLAALLVACDPILLVQSTAIMTETLATFLAALGWWFWNRRWSRCPKMQRRGRTGPIWMLRRLGLGTVLALAFLCRPTFLVWAVLLLLGECFWGYRRNRTQPRRVWVSAIAMALPLVLAMMSWIIRNQRQVDAPVWATTHGGYTLLLANNPLFYQHIAASPWRIGPLDRRWDASDFLAAHACRYNGDPATAEFWEKKWQVIAPEMPTALPKSTKGLPESTTSLSGGKSFRAQGVVTEVSDDRYLQRAAIATIQRSPLEFLRSCLVRLARLWSPLPHEGPEVLRIGIGVFYTAVLVVAFWGLLASRWYCDRLWWPGIALVIALSAVHAVYWSNLRMRAPATIVLAVAVAMTVPKRLTLSENGTICYAGRHEAAVPKRRSAKRYRIR